MDAHQRVAIVTGGGKGIGASTSRKLAGDGARVVVNYVQDEASAARVVSDIVAAGGEAVAVRGDVREPADCRALVDAATERYGSADIVVCNAHMAFRPTFLAELEWDDLLSKVSQELAAAFTLTKLVTPLMKERKYGRLVYVSSDSAVSPSYGGTVAHGTAKAALEGFARFVASDVAAYGITANVVSPTLLKTAASTQIAEGVFAGLAAHAPMQRLPSVDEVAAVVAFFASDACSYVTAGRVSVSGGLTIGR
jgi:3-oxoacyl-[acyl-carrier protein] reductase